MYFIIMPILYRLVSHKFIQIEQIPFSSFVFDCCLYTQEFLEVLRKPTANKLVVLCADKA